MNEMYKIGSLFDGSGGFPLAGTLCGIEPAWASEVEPYPVAVTRSRFPKMRHLGDISKVDGAEIEPVDIITFGSPCQDLSVAGKQAGIKHADNGDEETTRSGLFMEAVRIIKEMRSVTNGNYPKFCIWENVPGAFSSNGGADFRIVLEELIKIVEPSAVMPDVPRNGWAYADSFVGDGWSLAYRLFDAQYWGVPQRRRRIHLVLDLTGQRARSVLFVREGVRGYFAPGGTPWQDAPADAQGSAGADDSAGAGAGDGRGRQLDGLTYPAVAQTLTARADGSPQPDKGNGAPIVAVGLDVYNQATSGDKAISIRCKGDNEHTPCVVYDARGNGDGRTVSTVTGDHENRITDYSSVVVEPTCTHGGAPAVSFNWQAAAGAGLCVEEDIVNPLACTRVPALAYGFDPQADRDVGQYFHAEKGNTLVNGTCPGHKNGVVYALDRAAFNQGANAQYDPEITDSGVNSTIVARGPSAVCYSMGIAMQSSHGINAAFDEQMPTLVNGSNPGYQDGVCYWDGGQVSGTLTARNAGGCQRMPDKDNFVAVVEGKPRYIVRRLTPTECARLQGFPDWWGTVEEKKHLTEEEYRFWLDVRNTHAAINGKAVKDYTAKQMLTWYNKLHTDSAEYKMWGNGIALPPALYCMQGIRDALDETADDWMN